MKRLFTALLALLFMASVASAATIKLRRDSAADWTSNNPTLSEGEVGYETDTGKFKIGDGSTGWTTLVYQNDKLGSANIVPDSGTFTFDESAANPNDADVRLSATDGVLKFAAVNGENNEDLTVDLDQTANTAILGSSTGLTLITTGAIPAGGAIKVVGKSSDYTIGTDNANEAYGAVFFNTGASTRVFTLPSAAAGMYVCVRNAQGVNQILRLDAGSGDYIVMSTGARTSAAAEYYGATASPKNQVCVVAYDATDWYVTGEAGTWTEEE
jgi:hypothetical protein